MAEINEMKQNKMLCKEIEKLTFWKEYFDCIEQLRYPEKALIKAENNVAQQQIKCEELYQKMQEANEKFISSSKYDEQK